MQKNFPLSPVNFTALTIPGVGSFNGKSSQLCGPVFCPKKVQNVSTQYVLEKLFPRYKWLSFPLTCNGVLFSQKFTRIGKIPGIYKVPLNWGKL